MQQELPLDIVAHLFAQPFAAAGQFLAEAPFRDAAAVPQGDDLAVEFGQAHLVHDAAGVQPLLREDLDLAHVHGFAGGGDGHGEFHLGVEHEQLAQGGAGLGHLAWAQVFFRVVLAGLAFGPGALRLPSLRGAPFPALAGFRRSAARAVTGGPVAAGIFRRIAPGAGGCAPNVIECEEPVEAGIEQLLFVYRLRQRQGQGTLQQFAVLVADQFHRIECIEGLRGGDADLGVAQGADEIG